MTKTQPNFSTTALYYFITYNSEIILLETTDIREIKATIIGDWLGKGSKLLINNNNYIVESIVIEPLYYNGIPKSYTHESNDEFQKGLTYDWTTNIRVFLTSLNS